MRLLRTTRRSLEIVVVAAVLLSGIGRPGASEEGPSTTQDVEIDVYVCATGDFTVLYNDAALKELHSCTKGVPVADVFVSNVLGDEDTGETNRDGTVRLGPIKMSSTTSGSIGVLAEGFACITVHGVRIAEDGLRPGNNVVAVRLYELDEE